MKQRKIPVKEIKKKVIEIERFDTMTLANTKIAVDRNLAELLGPLKEMGFKNVIVIPGFRGYPKNLVEYRSNLRFRNRVWKDKAIHCWLNDNGYNIFVTSWERGFNFFHDRNYSLIVAHADIMNDYSKLASSKIKILFDNASHPYVHLFSPPYSTTSISRSSKMSFPRIKKRKGGQEGKKKWWRKLRRTNPNTGTH